MAMPRIVRFAFLLTALLMWAPARQALAQEPTPSDDEVNQIAKQLYCPVCENIPLDVCPTQACAQWRELIRLKLADGWDEQQIKQYFAEQYGDRVLAMPPARGLNWLAYIVPMLVILVVALVFLSIILILVFRGLGLYHPRPKQAASIIEPAPVDEYVARLEEELRRR
jgi:cytochrome c-type biogenesis protein CcmH